jgi:hypothetical protein
MMIISPFVLEDDAVGVDLTGGGAEMKSNPLLLMHLAYKRTELGTEDTLERHRLPADHVHLEPSHGQRRRHLEADERRADHDGASLRIVDDRPAIVEGAKQVSSRRAWNIKSERRRPGREQNRVERLRTAFEDQLLPFEPTHGFTAQGDAVFGEVLRRPQRNPFFGCVSREVVFREVRPINRRRRLRREQRDGPFIPFTPQHLCGCCPRRTSPDDRDRLRTANCRPPRITTRRGRTLTGALEHIQSVAATLDREARNRIQRGRPTRFTGCELEACVMPRATDRVAHDDPVRERCAIVRACRADSEEHFAPANEQDRLSVRLSGNRFPLFQC